MQSSRNNTLPRPRQTWHRPPDPNDYLLAHKLLTIHWDDGALAGTITPLIHAPVEYDSPGYVSAQAFWQGHPKDVGGKRVRPKFVSRAPLREGQPVFLWETPLWYVADNTFPGLTMIGVLTGKGRNVRIKRWHPLVFEMEDIGRPHGLAPTYHEMLLKLDGLIKGDIYYKQSMNYDALGEYAWDQSISFEREDDMMMAKLALT